MSELSCKKRDGRVVTFDADKIRKALGLCFKSTDFTDRVVLWTETIVRGVINSLKAKNITIPDVEDVQRLVIQQLWTAGLFAQAEHYQNYREEKNRARCLLPVSQEVQDRFVEMQTHFPTDLQIYQFMSKFARWRETDGRRETWKEAVYERITPWLFTLPGVLLTNEEKTGLQTSMYTLEASPAMRVVQMAGPALDRCNVGAYNCAYAPMSDPFAFAELLYILMQGTGMGFSCEDEYVSQLPRIKRQNGKSETLVVEDTTEDWCDTFHRHLNLLWDGWDTKVDVSKVRKNNARLRTKGGRSSGPDPLVELLDFSRSLFKSRQGKFLEDIDVHDMSCKIGTIVQVGGVRRAAEISLSDQTSLLMRNAKSGNWYAHSVHRTMSNNSAVYEYEDRPPVEVFVEEWASLIRSKSGERGIFNRTAANATKPARRLPWKFGCNPCGEIILRPFEFCNLSIAVARSWDTPESLKRKVRTAAYFGKIQSMATRFNYIRNDWRKNCEEERLLGVDVTGHADCPHLRFGAPGRAQLLRDFKEEVHKVDIMLSERWGVSLSAANTTVKPGGDSSVFFDCASGVSDRYAAKQVRWVREPKDTPIAKFLRESGVPTADAPERPGELAVFGFPKCAPAGTTTRNDHNAIQQLENWMEWKENYTEHNVSCTIYVDDHEWLDVGAWVYRNFSKINGISFLPKDNGIYSYAPNEELTELQYVEMVKNFPTINWAKLTRYEDEDQTAASATMACVGGSCQ